MHFPCRSPHLLALALSPSPNNTGREKFKAGGKCRLWKGSTGYEGFLKLKSFSKVDTTHSFTTIGRIRTGIWHQERRVCPCFHSTSLGLLRVQGICAGFYAFTSRQISDFGTYHTYQLPVSTTTKWCSCFFSCKGPSIYDVRKILGFFDPLPPLSAFGTDLQY